MPSPVCTGFVNGESVVSCCFSTTVSGAKALGTFEGRCVWCNPSEMNRRCATQQLRKLLVHNLRILKSLNADVFAAACKRLPDEWRQRLVAEIKPSEDMGDEMTPSLQKLPAKKPKNDKNDKDDGSKHAKPHEGAQLLAVRKKKDQKQLNNKKAPMRVKKSKRIDSSSESTMSSEAPKKKARKHNSDKADKDARSDNLEAAQLHAALALSKKESELPAENAEMKGLIAENEKLREILTAMETERNENEDRMKEAANCTWNLGDVQLFLADAMKLFDGIGDLDGGIVATGDLETLIAMIPPMVISTRLSLKNRMLVIKGKTAIPNNVAKELARVLVCLGRDVVDFYVRQSSSAASSGGSAGSK